MEEVGIGIHYSSNAKAVFFTNGIASFGEDAKPYTPPQNIPSFDEISSAEWSPWGSDNLLPYEMRDHIENCGVLNAALDGKGRIGIGKGFQPFLLTNVTNDGKEELEWVSDAEIHDWLEANNTFDFAFDSLYDFNSYGWNTGRYIFNKAGNKINRIVRDDVFTARIEKSKDSVIKNLFLCSNWKDAGLKYDKDKMMKIPLLREYYEQEDLIERLKSDPQVAFINRRRRNGRSNYPFPLWWSARAWVKIARSVPAMKNAMFQNQMQIKYLIYISEQYFKKDVPDWDKLDPDKKKAVMANKRDEIEEWLTGDDNAYKSITTGKYYDTVQKTEVKYIEIEVLDDKVKDGKLLPDSSAANSEILFSVMMNPALIGAGQPGGAYANNAGGSNIRESYLVQLMLMEAERKMNTEQWIPIKKINGWAKKYEAERKVGSNLITPRLVLRYPSGLLTTLDTGKSTKSENV